MRTAALILLAIAMPAAAADRADKLGLDGIYRGKIGMQLDTQKGKIFQADGKFIVMPDGKAATLTAQHPDGVLTVVMRGEFKGPLFLAKSKGREDYGGFHEPMQWDIRFNTKAGTATLHGKALNIPKWAKDDDLTFTFKKEKAKP